MKLSFLKFRTKSHLKKNKTIRVNVPFSKASSIGVIFSVEDRQKHEHIKEFIKKLEQEGKQVTVMTYLPNKKESYEFLFDFFTIKDITFWGQINATNAVKFSETPFDYLYCFDLSLSPIVENVLARSKAHCRVGRFSEEVRPFFELMVDSANNTKMLIDIAYKYTHQLK